MAAVPIQHRVLSGIVLYLLAGGLFAAESDSVAISYREDNLSQSNLLRLNYRIPIKGLILTLKDGLTYKVFAFESQISSGEQYAVDHSFLGDLNWGPRLRKHLRFESNQYEDHRTGLASSIFNQAMLLGYEPKPDLAVYAGARSVKRYGLVDEGWTAELEYGDQWRTAAQGARIAIQGDRDDLQQHLSHSLQSHADYEINFARSSNFQTSFDWEDRVQSFYTDSLGSRQRRSNENLSWRTNFKYQLSDDLVFFHRLSWETQLTEISRQRIVETETLELTTQDRERFALLNTMGLEIKGDHLRSISSFQVESSQNKYYIDYSQRLYQINEDLQWELSGKGDSLVWRSQLSRLEYDTPDTTNYDDRDEWRLSSDLQFIWRPNPYMRTESGVKLNLFHLIYLFSSRSSENHWNRNLFAWSSLNWTRGRISGMSMARVRANYFDYDFDPIFKEMEQPTRSFIHRSLDLQQALTHRILNKWYLNGKLSVKWEDEGQLDWNAFIQQVRSERTQTETMIRLLYDFRGWKGWFGYLEHERLTTYSLQNRDDETWLGKGPLIGLEHKLGDRLSVDADARFIKVVDQERTYTLPKVYISLVYR